MSEILFSLGNDSMLTATHALFYRGAAACGVMLVSGIVGADKESFEPFDAKIKDQGSKLKDRKNESSSGIMMGGKIICREDRSLLLGRGPSSETEHPFYDIPVHYYTTPTLYLNRQRDTIDKKVYFHINH